MPGLRSRNVRPPTPKAGPSYIPGTYRGLAGVRLAPGQRLWAPFGSATAGGGRFATAFYDHGYRADGEHYHLTHEDLVECRKLYGDPA